VPVSLFVDTAFCQYPTKKQLSDTVAVYWLTKELVQVCNLDPVKRPNMLKLANLYKQRNQATSDAMLNTCGRIK